MQYYNTIMYLRNDVTSHVIAYSCCHGMHSQYSLCVYVADVRLSRECKQGYCRTLLIPAYFVSSFPVSEMN